MGKNDFCYYSCLTDGSKFRDCQLILITFLKPNNHINLMGLYSATAYCNCQLNTFNFFTSKMDCSFSQNRW